MRWLTSGTWYTVCVIYFLCTSKQFVSDHPRTFSDVLRQCSAQTCNVDVCFGLEDGSITTSQFRKQKQVFKEALSSLSTRNGARAAAVQYGASVRVVFQPTTNMTEAIRKGGELSMHRSPATSLGVPIAYCDSRLRRESGRQRKIVLFSTGESNLGGDPRRRSRVFRERSLGEIIVVPLGNSNLELLLDIAGDSSELFLLQNEGSQPSGDDLTDKICHRN